MLFCFYPNHALLNVYVFFSCRRRHTRWPRDWSSDVCSSDLKKVYVTYRKDALTGHEAQVTQLTNSSVTCYFNTSITNLIACVNQEVIEHVQLTNHTTGEVTSLPVDEVIINHGYEQDTALLENSDLNIATTEKYFVAGNANKIGRS